jgi:hypothetical protein
VGVPYLESKVLRLSDLSFSLSLSPSGVWIFLLLLWKF